MLDAGNVVKDLGVDRMPTQCLPRGTTDKFEGGPGGDDMDLMTGLGEESREQTRLVGGNSSSDTKDDDTHARLRSGVRISEISEGIVELDGRGLLGRSGLSSDLLGVHLMGLNDTGLDLTHGDR